MVGLQAACNQAGSDAACERVGRAFIALEALN